MEKRLSERQAASRELGREVLAFVEKEAGALDDAEKRRIFKLGTELAEGRWTGF
jgi:hypothetical protein